MTASATHRHDPVPALMAAAASLSALVTIYLLAVHTYEGQLADTRTMARVADLLAGSTWTEEVLLLISPVSALAAACLLAAAAGALRGAQGVVVVITTTAGTTVGAEILKGLLSRPPLFDAAANSLPSGHVAAVAGLAAAAAAVASPRSRPVVIAGGLATVVLTGVATIALQWHRPSDVIASLLLAVAVAAVSRVAADVARPTSATATR